MAEATGLRFITRVLDGGLGLGISVSEIPDVGSPEALTKLLIEELKKRNIVFGIDVQAIFRMMSEKTLNDEVVVARGVPSKRGRDAELQLLVQPPSFNLQASDDARIDYKNIENLAEVKAGDLISRGVPADHGAPGTNIFGKEIRPPAVRERIRHPAGKNTEISDDGLEMRAAADGYLRWNGERIDVAEVFVAENDVDMRTGNIRYKGDVEVYGNVQRGFDVVAGGNVRVMGVVEGGHVVSEAGTVTVLGGVLGSGEGAASGSVIAEGDIQVGRARFARLESKTGSVIAEKAVEHSEIHAAGDLILRSGPASNCVIEVGGRVAVASLDFAADNAHGSEVITETSSSNRRKYVRVLTSPPIEARVIHEASKLNSPGHINDLSAGGMRLRVPERLREDRVYQLQFKLAGIEGVMWMDAEVVRTCQPLEGERPGSGAAYGLRFVHIESAVRESIVRFCLAEDLRQHRMTGKTA